METGPQYSMHTLVLGLSRTDWVGDCCVWMQCLVLSHSFFDENARISSMEKADMPCIWTDVHWAPVAHRFACGPLPLG